MSEPSFAENRREQFRIAPQDQRQQQGRLLIGKQKVVCEVGNESAGGFMVQLKKSVKIRPDEELELQQVDRSTPVRLLWTRKEKGGVVTLGLERLPEHEVTYRKKGGLILMAFAVLAAVFAAHLLKNDHGVRQFLLKHQAAAADK